MRDGACRSSKKRNGASGTRVFLLPCAFCGSCAAPVCTSRLQQPSLTLCSPPREKNREPWNEHMPRTTNKARLRPVQAFSSLLPEYTAPHRTPGISFSSSSSLLLSLPLLSLLLFLLFFSSLSSFFLSSSLLPHIQNEDTIR